MFEALLWILVIVGLVALRLWSDTTHPDEED